MEAEQARKLRLARSALQKLVGDVAIHGQSMDDNETRQRFRALYATIEKELQDSNLALYAPAPSNGTSFPGGQHLWHEHQVEIVHLGSCLVHHVEAVLREETTDGAGPGTKPTDPPKVFISHGSPSSALSHLRDFIVALGLVPIIVKDSPSMGMSVDLKVETHLKSCQAAIILATGDDRIAGASNLQPRLNVIHEIGLSQSLLPGRIIYLVEANTEFPSNVAPKVYERFTRDNLTQAFIAVARELRALALL